MVWTAFIWLRLGLVVGPYEHGNEPFEYIKCWEILEYLSARWLLKKD
jgi:hypothetical protein